MTIQNYRTPSGKTLSLEIADTFWKRFCGLMLRKELPEGCGLYLAPCSSIHMCFMRFAIDAVFVDKVFTIQKIATHVRPWIGVSLCLHAHGVIELPDGAAEEYGMKVGQRLVEEE